MAFTGQDTALNEEGWEEKREALFGAAGTVAPGLGPVEIAASLIGRMAVPLFLTTGSTSDEEN